jgi:U2-associated protein SR140
MSGRRCVGGSTRPSGSARRRLAAHRRSSLILPQRDADAAARELSAFVADFGGSEGDEPGPAAAAAKPFVRGGVIDPAPAPGPAGAASRGAAGAPRRHYAPPPPAAAAAAAAPWPGSLADATADLPPTTAPALGGAARPRKMDLLLEDLKREQAAREARRAAGLPPDPADAAAARATAAAAADGASTNLCVGNLAPELDEAALLQEFGRFGAVASVKVMWPRDEEARARARNTGFVAFMRRADAEAALRALDGAPLRDLALAVGWGRAVPLPPAPLAWPPGGGDVFAAAGAAAPEATRERRHDGPPPAPPVAGRGADVVVTPPADERRRFAADAAAHYIARDGAAFEAALARACAADTALRAEFAFLFDTASPDHAYYRWRLFSLASGDSLSAWRAAPFLMVEASRRWVPPPMTALAGDGVGARPARAGDAPLPPAARVRFEALLAGLTVGRAAVREAMAFALDHADAAADVAALLAAALAAPDAPVGLRVARLFLLSDILHNTGAGARNAARYRLRLQDALPDAFEALRAALAAAGGRLAQEALRRHVLRVLRAWRGWFVFSDDFLNGLQATFLHGGAGPGGAPTAPGAGADPALAPALAALDDEALAARCRRAGLSRAGGRGEQVARLLALDAYLGGGEAAAAKRAREGARADKGGAPKRPR